MITNTPPAEMREAYSTKDNIYRVVSGMLEIGHDASKDSRLQNLCRTIVNVSRMLIESYQREFEPMQVIKLAPATCSLCRKLNPAKTN